MRVLVTRARDQGRATARRLAALGHEAVLVPLSELAPTEQPPPPDSFAALLVTSANAVPALAASHYVGAGLPVFAVGERSAGLLRKAGFPDVRTAAGDAAALAQDVAGAMPAGTALLHAAGRDRKPEPAASLRRLGYPVTVWETYEARLAAALPAALADALRAGALEAALHYSHRGAAQLAGLAASAGLGGALAAIDHVCLSADVAQALDRLGAARIVVAARPDESSLLSSLAELAGERPGSAPPQSP